MADVLSHTVMAPSPESTKSYDPVILVSVGLLLIIALLIVTVSGASAPLQESIQSALVW
jgi:hypothetical protein